MLRPRNRLPGPELERAGASAFLSPGGNELSQGAIEGFKHVASQFDVSFHVAVSRCTTHFRTYFSGDWDVHWGYGVLTHSHMEPILLVELLNRQPFSHNIFVIFSTL